MARALQTLSPLLWVVAILGAAQQVLSAPWKIWNGIRLAPSGALAEGLGLMPAGAGHPITGHLYGPVSPVYFLPAALLPTPTSAVLMASALAFVAVTAPLAVMLRTEARGDRLAFWIPLGLFVLNGVGSPVVRQVTFAVHADAPALGLGVLACALVYRPADRRKNLRLVLSAVATALAVMAKQPMLPLILVLPAYALMTEGVRRALICLAANVAAMAALVATFAVLPLGGLALVIADPGAVVSAMSWREATLARALVQSARDLVPAIVPYWALAGAFALARTKGHLDREALRSWVSANPWLLPAIVSLACVPTALLSRSVAGASTNGLGFAIYFAAVTCLLILARVLSTSGDQPADVLMPGLRLGLLVLVATSLVANASALWELPGQFRQLSSNPQAQALRYAVDHPEAAYFPLHPLVGLKAEGRLYNVLLPATTRVALADPLAAGDPVAVERVLLRHMPSRVRWILYPNDLHPRFQERSEALRRDLWPHLGSEHRLPEMPGWAAFDYAGER